MQYVKCAVSVFILITPKRFTFHNHICEFELHMMMSFQLISVSYVSTGDRVGRGQPRV